MVMDTNFEFLYFDTFHSEIHSFFGINAFFYSLLET